MYLIGRSVHCISFWARATCLSRYISRRKTGMVVAFTSNLQVGRLAL